MKRLIVNADDFGRSPGAIRGVFDAHHKGIVTSTTVMVNFPDAAAGIEQALSGAPDLGLGLHLNLTSGPPVSSPNQVASLVRGDGQFYHISEWAARFEALDPDDLRREIEAQVARFIRLAGKPPDHLDSHHHASYLHPAALRAMLEIATRFNIPLRQTGLEIPRERAVGTLTGMVAGMEPEFAGRLLGHLAAVIAEGPEPFCPARFESGFYDERATLGDLLVMLTTLPDDSVTELMCHPGYVDEALARSPYNAPREAEIAHLTHAATLECVRSEGIQLMNFGDFTR